MVIKNDCDGNRVSETIGGVTTKYLVDTLNPTGYAQLMDEVVGTAVSRMYKYARNQIGENQFGAQHVDAEFMQLRRARECSFLTNPAGAATDIST